ncbi:2'-5' RNA ligase family protein [Agrobacterium sp. Ap1]|uniref:2'-5' RNA ligase family protein n=1 Tax=Agrobacterium sp. Ap1 TaxID=2815337 RepID=UPI0017FDDB1F|nr:2'-5' RNA ligase family protein [Agrobacterium sp. Ap1]
MIITAHVELDDMEPFDRLRQEHFPPARNFLKAHVTIFHHLPGQRLAAVKEILAETLLERTDFLATVSGIQHLGAGVAFKIESPELQELRAELSRRFGSWPGPQDLQKFRPHITIQNKVSRAKADQLFFELTSRFEPKSIRMTGLDLWSYLGGPWRHEGLMSLSDREGQQPQSSGAGH